MLVALAEAEVVGIAETGDAAVVGNVVAAADIVAVVVEAVYTAVGMVVVLGTVAVVESSEAAEALLWRIGQLFAGHWAP